MARVVPAAAAGSLMFTPDITLPALRDMRDGFGDRIYGRYGFADAFHPTDGWVNPDVIGIDLGISLLSAENLRSGRVWQWFMAESGDRCRHQGHRRLSAIPASRELDSPGFRPHPNRRLRCSPVHACSLRSLCSSRRPRSAPRGAGQAPRGHHAARHYRGAARRSPRTAGGDGADGRRRSARQLALGRLQLQEQRINTLVRRLEEVQRSAGTGAAASFRKAASGPDNASRKCHETPR